MGEVRGRGTIVLGNTAEDTVDSLGLLVTVLAINNIIFLDQLLGEINVSCENYWGKRNKIKKVIFEKNKKRAEKLKKKNKQKQNNKQNNTEQYKTIKTNPFQSQHGELGGPRFFQHGYVC